MAALSVLAVVIVTLALRGGTGETQALGGIAVVPNVAADSATYAPTPPTPSPSSKASPKPSPSATPSPSPSASPAPTPDIDGCFGELCLQKVSAYESGGMWHVVGEVVNNGEGASKRASGVTLQALFFDDVDFVLRDGTGTTPVGVIAGANDEVQLNARNVSPFHIAVQSHATAWTWYRVEITDATVPANGDLARNLNPTVLSESFSGGYSVSGTISNDSGHDYAAITVTVALYAEGRVVRVETVSTSPADIADDGTGSFAIAIPDAPSVTLTRDIFVFGVATN